MLTQQHIEEALSRACLAAVAGRAGLNVSWYQNDYGIDCTIHQIQKYAGKLLNSGLALDIQLKATSRFTLARDSVLYDLDATTYNSILEKHSKSSYAATRCVLVLMCLPKGAETWLTTSEEQLVMRHCLYWIDLEGEPTKNSSSVRLQIPREQVLTPEAISHLITSVYRASP